MYVYLDGLKDFINPPRLEYSPKYWKILDRKVFLFRLSTHINDGVDIVKLNKKQKRTIRKATVEHGVYRETESF